MPRLTDRPAPRVTLLDLADKERLRAWLGLTEARLRELYLDANPRASSWRGYSTRPMAETDEFKRMTVADLFDWYFDKYLNDLQAEWIKRNKPPTWTQVLMEYAAELGFRTGSLAERRRRAIAARPDIYAPVIKTGWTDGCRRVLGATYGDFRERRCQD